MNIFISILKKIMSCRHKLGFNIFLWTAGLKGAVSLVLIMNENSINNYSRLILKRILGVANIIVNVYLDFLYYPLFSII